MAKARKKSIGQQVVGIATVGMPQPVKNIVGSRWGSRLFLVLAAVLFGAGIVTVQWTNGWPKLQVDRDRAQEVKQTIVSEFHSAEGRKQDKDAGNSWFNSENVGNESSPIREIFGQDRSEQESTKPPLFSRLGSTADDQDRSRGMPSKSAPQPDKREPPARGTKFPWFR